MARKKKKGCCSPHTKKGNEISTNATTKETWEILTREDNNNKREKEWHIS
jgi:hypothetical protein